VHYTKRCALPQTPPDPCDLSVEGPGSEEGVCEWGCGSPGIRAGFEHSPPACPALCVPPPHRCARESGVLLRGSARGPAVGAAVWVGRQAAGCAVASVCAAREGAGGSGRRGGTEQRERGGCRRRALIGFPLNPTCLHLLYHSPQLPVPTSLLPTPLSTLPARTHPRPCAPCPLMLEPMLLRRLRGASRALGVYAEGSDGGWRVGDPLLR
jgi:hypothetical protein